MKRDINDDYKGPEHHLPFHYCTWCGRATQNGDRICTDCREQEHKPKEPEPYPWEANYKKPPF